MSMSFVNLSDHSLDQMKDLPGEDWRLVTEGRTIPSLSYSDQPYILKTSDGAWLCCLTTGAGAEGHNGQHIITLRSLDRGLSWSNSAAVESPDGPEASYAVMAQMPSGRIYIFYNYNADHIRQVKADNPPYPNGYCTRVDSLGQYVFRYSDDQGQTWCANRYPIPVRAFDIDLQNAYQGDIRFFWNVGKPVIREDSLLIPLHKVGGFGEGFFTRSEGVFLYSDNILTEQDPEKIHWQTLPDGQQGLRTPPGGGPIAEEQSLVEMSDGSLYCVYRSTDGHPVFSYSRDGGHHWTEPQYQAYADGRLMKHPRAANFIWKCRNGKYLYWFHNHGGRDYDDRNPVWICGGEESPSPDGLRIRWSQPEILLYDDDPYIRMSYPDLLEDDGMIYVTETQKSIARIHQIHPHLLQMLWRQSEINQVTRSGLLFELSNAACHNPVITWPDFIVRDYLTSDFRRKDLRQGISFDLWLDLQNELTGCILLDTIASGDRGICLSINHQMQLELVLSDGQTTNMAIADCHPLHQGGLHHVGVLVDNGPKVICFVIDGQLLDGDQKRQFGWTRYSPNLRNVNSPNPLAISSNGIRQVRLYGRTLLVTEMISNFRAGIGHLPV